MFSAGLTDMVDTMLMQGLQLCQQGRFEEASVHYTRIIAIAPTRAEPYLNMGHIALSEARYEDALAWFSKAAQLWPGVPTVLMGMGQALLALGKSEDALRTFTRLQTTDPKSDMALRGRGEALSQLGRMQDARAAFEQAVILAPTVAGHHYALAQVARFVENDTRLPALEAIEKKISLLSPPAQADLHFALAKARDETGRVKDAMYHWQAANSIRRQITSYDENMFLGMLQALADAFPADSIKKRSGRGNTSDAPVFIVGMPRSGTTLVEQILVSHPNIHSVGESMLLHEILGQNMAGPDFPHYFSDVPDTALADIGAYYADKVAGMAPGAIRIVDKLTANFMLCGFIHLITPHARIIHVQRDPRDTCFSCYTNQFSQNFDYTYDQRELGRYWRGYATLMAHWRKVLPPDAMLEVQYETLVTNVEDEARRLISYCGLQWNDACLEFFKTPHTVQTLSAAQVRQPIYRTSIGRWKAYEAFLEPLLTTLNMPR